MPVINSNSIDVIFPEHKMSNTSQIANDFFFPFLRGQGKFQIIYFSTCCAELFKTVSVTTADKDNVNVMLISTGCSVTSVFHPCKFALVNTSVNVEAEWGGGLKF